MILIRLLGNPQVLDNKVPKGLLRLVRPKSLQLGNPEKQKPGLFTKVRHSMTSPQHSVRNLSYNLPAMGIQAVEGGVMAIEDGIHTFKKKAAQRKLKTAGNGDVVLDRRRTLDEGKLRRTGQHDITGSITGLRLKPPESQEDENASESNHDVSNQDHPAAAYNRRSSTRSSRSSLSKSSVSRRSSISSASIASDRRKLGLASSLPANGLNALNTNDRGELITWDDLEDAIYIGLHNSISDIDAEVNYKQEWNLQSTDTVHAPTTNEGATSSITTHRTPSPQRVQHHFQNTNVTTTTAASQQNSTDNEKGPWRCSKCTFINENPMHLICDVCTLPRD